MHPLAACIATAGAGRGEGATASRRAGHVHKQLRGEEVLSPLEGFLALASLAAFLTPPRWAPALLLAGPLVADLRGEASSLLTPPAAGVYQR